MMEQAQKLCDRILMLNKGQRVLYGTVADIRKEHGKNSLFVEFADKGSLSIIREIPGIKKITCHEGTVEIFPEDGVSAQAVLQELAKRAEILRFEQAFPSLNEVFIETVESASVE
jgi:ABC-2 type transport system ATP-binding protein